MVSSQAFGAPKACMQGQQEVARRRVWRAWADRSYAGYRGRGQVSSEHTEDTQKTLGGCRYGASGL